MPTVLFHNAEPFFGCNPSNDFSYSVHGYTGFALGNGSMQGSPCRLYQMPRLVIYLATVKRGVCVAVISIQINSDVDIAYITILKASTVRNAVTDNIVNGCADGLGEALIMQRRGIRPVGYDHLMYCLVDLIGSHTRLDKSASIRKNLCRKSTRLSHLKDGRRALNINPALKAHLHLFGGVHCVWRSWYVWGDGEGRGHLASLDP
mmetsp:Transcript_42396/g.68760  ORF Transcript_42396/g.68760 Transcript_42396/m.68760 type:complete len:205 (-) Transcript_42396:409-1023(-)